VWDNWGTAADTVHNSKKTKGAAALIVKHPPEKPVPAPEPVVESEPILKTEPVEEKNDEGDWGFSSV
jgi:hypothetical protein